MLLCVNVIQRTNPFSLLFSVDRVACVQKYEVPDRVYATIVMSSLDGLRSIAADSRVFRKVRVRGPYKENGACVIDVTCPFRRMADMAIHVDTLVRNGVPAAV